MKYIKYIALAGLVGLTSSCIDDLLNRPATTEVSSDLFWTSTDDALSSTYGVYNAVRTLFATDYYYDGHGEFQNTRGKSIGDISSWGPGTPGSGFSSMWNNAYRVINRANYTIQYVEQMIQAEQNAVTKASLELSMPRITSCVHWPISVWFKTGVMFLTIATYSAAMMKHAHWYAPLLLPSFLN